MLGRLIKLVIIGGSLATIAALAAVGPRPFEGYLPPAAAAFVEDVVGPNGLLGQGGNVKAGAVAADFLVDGPEGLQATGPIAASAGNVPVFISDVLSGHETNVERAFPAAITTIRPILGCLLTPPMEGSFVGYATGSGTALPMALVSYSDADLAMGVVDFVDRYRKRGIAAPVPGDAYAFHAQDIVVTETGAPVYLVLENTGGNRIWNIHLAEGARVERVVLLGGAQSGVGNLDPVVPVEVILDDGLAGCGIRPAQPLNRGHALLQTASDAEATLIAEAAAAYDIWFRDSFGVTASESRVGFDGGSVALIGPLPGAAGPKVRYATITGADIRTTQDTYFEIVGQVAEGQDYGSRVMDLATGFAFGDLTILRQGVSF